jgi:aminoglycoside phosphotransferase family enzyme
VPQLLAVYTAYRALLRARLSAAHLLEPDPREPERWLPQAARYIEFALRALEPRASGGT